MNLLLLSWYTGDIMKYQLQSCAIALTLLIAGCGGGGGSNSAIPNTVSPTTTPTPIVTSSPGGSTTGSVNNASITIAAPIRSASGLNSVTPLSSIVAVITSINNSTSIPSTVNPTTSVAITSNTCSYGTDQSQCTFTLPAPAGSISAVISEYAGSDAVATGSFTFNSTGAAGQSETFTLGAIAGNVTITPPSFVPDQPSVQQLDIAVTDPSGALLTGNAPFAEPLTITDTDAGGTTQIEEGTDQTTLGKTAPFTNPGALVSIVYNGGGDANIHITASGQSARVATTSGYRTAPYKSN